MFDIHRKAAKIATETVIGLSESTKKQLEKDVDTSAAALEKMARLHEAARLKQEVAVKLQAEKDAHVFNVASEASIREMLAGFC